jgi:hypothetical protein
MARMDKRQVILDSDGNAPGAAWRGDDAWPAARHPGLVSAGPVLPHRCHRRRALQVPAQEPAGAHAAGGSVVSEAPPPCQ